MKVTVKFSALPELVSIFEWKKEAQVDLTGDAVKDLLHHLFLKIRPKKGSIFINDRGEISPQVSVLINGRYIFGSNPLSQKLKENDVIELILAPG